jgi:hypothetical protein
MTNFSEILKDEHFNNLANLARSVFRSAYWKRSHAKVPFWTLWNDLDKVTPVSGGNSEWNIEQVLSAFADLLTAIVEADSTKSYSTEDIAWLVSVLDDKDLRKVTISLWKAYASAPASLVTPAEAAELTGTSESGWRNRAAAGDVPGAFKKGKQWLIPYRALGLDGDEEE